MRKKTIAVLLIIIVLTAALFYPVTQNDTISINASFDNTLLQVIHIDHWKNWYPQIKKAYKENLEEYHLATDSSKKIYTIIIPGKKITIHAVTPMAYDVTETGKHSRKNFAFSVFPGEYARQMKVFFTQKVPLLSAILQKKDSNNIPLEGLKNFLETPEQFYGFDIKIAQIRDSIIASLVFKTKQEDIFKKMAGAREQLTEYLKTNNLQKTGYISVSYIPLLRDSIQITVGIPVNKIASPADGIKCLALPGKGRVLVANYEGKFSDRYKVYQAMTKYLTDHTLSIPAESFERYLNDSLPASDSSEISMELNYPVY